uniref:Ig-like domain-containing protein n=1 Tax=Sander lucioperca TaxID=283035 RepID=A0A8C9ZB57_SANLU
GFFSLIQMMLNHHEVTVKAGEDVTLQCQAPRDAQINMFEWIRSDLESDGYIFRFIPEESTTRNQLPSYRGRVERRDPDMKDGDLSVVLKNVRVKDTGTYRCRVGISGGEKPKVYSTIQLTVSGEFVELTDSQELEATRADCGVASRLLSSPLSWPKIIKLLLWMYLNTSM